MDEKFESDGTTREQAMEAARKFLGRKITDPDLMDPNNPEAKITSPDLMDLNDPEVKEANELFYKWQAEEQAKTQGDERAEAEFNFAATTFYVDAGFTDRTYLEDVLDFLEQDLENVELHESWADIEEKIKKKINDIRATKIEGRGLNPESKEKYTELLLAGLETNREYEKLSRILYQEKNKGAVSENTRDKIKRLKEEIERELQERINLLRQAGVTNVETVFPRVKRDQGAEDAPFEELNPQEVEQFAETMKKLAEDNGYEIEFNRADDLVTVKRNGLEFQMRHHAIPRKSGIGGYGRIAKMSVYRETQDGEKELLLNYGSGSGITNQDTVLQEETDRVIALFG